MRRKKKKQFTNYIKFSFPDPLFCSKSKMLTVRLVAIKANWYRSFCMGQTI